MLQPLRRPRRNANPSACLQPPRPNRPGGFSGVTPAEFRALYPAFKATDESWITAALAQSEALTGDTWGTETRDYIVGLTTAAAMARSPQGRAANLVSEDGSSTYSVELDDLRRANACIAWRLG